MNARLPFLEDTATERELYNLQGRHVKNMNVVGELHLSMEVKLKINPLIKIRMQ